MKDCSFAQFDLWFGGVCYQVRYVNFRGSQYDVEVVHDGKLVSLFVDQDGIVSAFVSGAYIAAALAEGARRGTLYQ